MAYDNTNSGALFRNDRKEEGTNQADHNGSATILCPHCGATTEYWQNAWIKESKAGRKFFSQSFKSKQDIVKPEDRAKPTGEFIDDEIPF